MRVFGRETSFAKALFAAACLHATFLFPYAVLVAGERMNLFTTLVVALPGLWLAFGYLRWPLPWRALAPWLLLGAGLAASALASPDQLPSGLRALAFFCPAVAGLVCAHGLFQKPESRVFLFRVLTVCFTGLIVSHLIFGSMPLAGQ